MLRFCCSSLGRGGGGSCFGWVGLVGRGEERQMDGGGVEELGIGN